VGGSTGDLRLLPDVAAVRVLAAHPGWAWAPAAQYAQSGEVFGCCQRSFARCMTEEARRRGFEVRVGTERMALSR
jgi:glutamine synthetase